ncbi:hypothetical protein AYO38_04575 [bacterium SCGC AG-212-C10]|nr:hypothetical protein AYO38_04575 [bacterium SCGC AG-212-C10]
MAEMPLPLNRSVGRRISDAAVNGPRVVMSWEDWLTLAAAVIAFVSVAISIQQAHWVARMPPVVPTALAGLVIGLFAARIRFTSFAVQPIAIALGLVVVILAVQQYADGVTFNERLTDTRIRMDEWWGVVRAGDISNDNLPFVFLVHSITFLAAYLASWSIYRWQNAWLAVLPVGIVLLANISFLEGQPSATFIVFLFGAIVLIGRLHLQKAQTRWKRQGVEYPDFISLNATQLTVMLTVGLIVAAWLIPLGKQADAVQGVFDKVVSPATSQSETLTRLFHNVDSRKGARLHNFGATLPIQGNVKLGTKAIFEVQSGEPGLIRGASYDEYTGNGWKATDRDTARVDGGEIADTEGNTDYLQRNVTILRVKTLDDESTVLTLGTPLITTLDSLVDTPKDFTGDIERIRSRRGLTNGDTYNAFGSQSRATEEELRGAGDVYPDWVAERYLQLPKSLPQRVRDESQRIVNEAGATNPYDASIAIQEYLRTFPYNLGVESAPPGRDTVDFLLFDLHAGYFDYNATGMAVMLRTLGIPARITVGYLLDTTEATETTYTVRKDDAYAWVEAYFPQYGWITFNPTTGKPGGGAGGLGSSEGAGASAEPFVDLNELEGFLGQGTVDVDESGIAQALNETPVDNKPFPWWIVWTLGGALAVAAVTFTGGRIAWNWGLGGLEGRARLWAKIHRLAGWAGLRSRQAETPREWSRRVGSAVDREHEATALAMAYEEARYGRPDLQKIDDADAEGAYKRVRKALVAVILRRNRKQDE